MASEHHPAALVQMLAGELGCERCHRRARASGGLDLRVGTVKASGPRTLALS